MSAIFQQAVIDSDATKVKFLFKYARGIRIDQANQNGMTALQQASWDGNLELVNFLLENGADLSLGDREGSSTLHLASQAGHLEVVSLLVNSACADVNARNDSGQKPIDLAKTDQIRALLSQVMLADDLKQRCTLTPLENDWDNNHCGSKLCVPGSRFSISSTSTDSGVSEDFVAPESSCDAKYSSYSKPGNAPVTNEQNHETLHDRPQMCSKGKNDNEGSIPTLRAINVTGVFSRGKSHSFSGRHDYATIYEAASAVDTEKTSARVERTVSNPPGRERYQRHHKLASRDPSRRKTVTFGENESRTISYEKTPRPRISSLRRPTTSNYADGSEKPECYGSGQASRARKDQVETAGSSRSDDRSPPNSKAFTQKSEEVFSRESKHRKLVMPGFLTKSLH